MENKKDNYEYLMELAQELIDDEEWDDAGARNFLPGGLMLNLIYQ